MRKIIWKIAGNLSQPYILLQGETPTSATSFLAKIKLNTAIFLYKKHYLIEPDKNGALFFIGKIYQALKDYTKALEYFEKLWETDPYNMVAFKEICSTCLDLRDYKKGLQYALKEVSQYPSNPESHANLAHFLLLSNRCDEACDKIRRAKEIDKNNSFVKEIETIINKYVVSRSNEQ